VSPRRPIGGRVHRRLSPAQGPPIEIIVADSLGGLRSIGLDPGTEAVVRNGMCVLYDVDQLLLELVDHIQSLGWGPVP
jgi:hypothetical protein